MTTALTPAQLIADIASLDRIEHDWLQRGVLDCITEKDLHDKKAELMDDLREGFTTGKTKAFDDWYAFEGIDAGRVMPIGYGATEIEAIETLLDLIGEDEAEEAAAAEEQSLDYFNRYIAGDR